jgi:hypothetical protein
MEALEGRVWPRRHCGLGCFGRMDALEVVVHPVVVGFGRSCREIRPPEAVFRDMNESFVLQMARRSRSAFMSRESITG